METTLLLLESKLASIDWLRQAEQGNAPVMPAADSWETDFKQGGAEEKVNDGDGNGADAPPQPAEDPLLSDPDMVQWFKMLKFGVPESAVRLKMSLNGVDDDSIDRVVQIHKSR
eukprot:UN01257